MRKIGLAIILLVVFTTMTSCNKGEKITEQTIAHLEQIIEIEKGFEESQEKIYALEKEDERLYQEIISLEAKDTKKINTLTNEALSLLDERLSLLEKEKESIANSQTEFEKIAPLIEKMEEEEIKDKAQKLYDTMMKRYASYEAVADTYTESIQRTKELYYFFQEGSFMEEEVYAVLENVNEGYEAVTKANDTFNRETISYNRQKDEFYTAIATKNNKEVPDK